MKLLGFYIGYHDSNVSLFDDKIHYYKSERLLQLKHHRADMRWIEKICEENNFIPDAIAFSDGNRNNLGICNPEDLFTIVEPIHLCGREINTYCLDHHYAHILSGWPVYTGKNVSYGVSIDGRGDDNYRLSIIKNPTGYKPEIVFRSKDYAICRLFNLIGVQMNLKGLEIDFAGKIMGAHAYGTIDSNFIDKYKNDDVMRFPLTLLDCIPWEGSPPTTKNTFFTLDNPSFRNWLATVHKLLEEFIVQLFKSYVPSEASVVYAGGAAQNTVFNERLYGLYPQLIIPPHSYDGGISLGCLEFLRMQFKLDAFSHKGFPFWQSDPDVGYANEAIIQEIAEHIFNGKTVGWVQGKGEIGPRALGHRSILYKANAADGKDTINTRIKKREYWRPYAGSILEKNLNRVTTISNLSSPYMLRAMEIQKQAQEQLSAIIHIDGTSRIQTVSSYEPELASFYRLLEILYESYGYLGVLNTSLNEAGGPIISTYEQALKFWKESQLDVLCVGDKVFLK